MTAVAKAREAVLSACDAAMGEAWPTTDSPRIHAALDALVAAAKAEERERCATVVNEVPRNGSVLVAGAIGEALARIRALR